MGSMRIHYARGRQPKGFWGRLALKAMNGSKHSALPEWVFSEVQFGNASRILDVGCGGGANVARLLKQCPGSHVTGMDNSLLALEITTDYNYHAIVDGNCIVVGGNAVQIPLAREVFDLYTAFETVYYWISIDKGISEAFRVLKHGGRIIIANEHDGLIPEDDTLARAVGTMRIYTPDEITQSMKDAGFTDIVCLQDEQRHFVCVTARKP